MKDIKESMSYDQHYDKPMVHLQIFIYMSLSNYEGRDLPRLIQRLPQVPRLLDRTPSAELATGFSRSTQCLTTRVIKAMVCIILSMG